MPTIGLFATTLGNLPITAAQCRAARGLVGIDQAALAKAAHVARNTIVSFESGQRTPGANNLAAIQRALESAAVVFLEPGAAISGGAGVRLLGPAETQDDLVAKIKARKAALPDVDHATKASPQKAEKQLERAHGKNEIAKLKNRRTKLKK